MGSGSSGGPRGRWQAVTLLATLTPTGFGPGLQLEGAVDRQAFDTFVTEALVPMLRPGDVIVLDNLAVHKSAVAQQAIEAAGATMRFLRTQKDRSPDPLVPAAALTPRESLDKVQTGSAISVVFCIYSLTPLACSSAGRSRPHLFAGRCIPATGNQRRCFRPSCHPSCRDETKG